MGSNTVLGGSGSEPWVGIMLPGWAPKVEVLRSVTTDGCQSETRSRYLSFSATRNDRPQKHDRGLRIEATNIDHCPCLQRGDEHRTFLRCCQPRTGALASIYDFEFIFTDNHSTDATFPQLRELACRDRRVRAYRFSRNFGYQRSIMTGYSRARGNAADATGRGSTGPS